MSLYGYIRVSTRDQNEDRQWQAEGIAAAKARGVKFGADQKPVPADFDEWYLRWRRREITGRRFTNTWKSISPPSTAGPGSGAYPIPP